MSEPETLDLKEIFKLIEDEFIEKIQKLSATQEIKWLCIDKYRYQTIKQEITQHLKSAVQGLLKEVKLRKISIDKLPNKKEIVFDTKEKFVSDFNQEIESIVEEIKKWFPDVVSEK